MVRTPSGPVRLDLGHGLRAVRCRRFRCRSTTLTGCPHSSIPAIITDHTSSPVPAPGPTSQAGQIPRVIINAAGDSHRAAVGQLPLRPIRLPALVGPAEGESLGRRLRAFTRLRLDQPGSIQDPRHRRPRRHHAHLAALQRPHDRLRAMIAAPPAANSTRQSITASTTATSVADGHDTGRRDCSCSSPSHPCASKRLCHL